MCSGTAVGPERRSAGASIDRLSPPERVAFAVRLGVVTTIQVKLKRFCSERSNYVRAPQRQCGHARPCWTPPRQNVVLRRSRRSPNVDGMQRCFIGTLGAAAVRTLEQLTHPTALRVSVRLRDNLPEGIRDSAAASSGASPVHGKVFDRGLGWLLKVQPAGRLQ